MVIGLFWISKNYIIAKDGFKLGNAIMILINKECFSCELDISWMAFAILGPKLFVKLYNWFACGNSEYLIRTVSYKGPISISDKPFA